uniref:Uncharacterized protein n=1 Tax=Anguilla anguilla TaxID=7936 RepID=A0A0E9TGV5_ANGAN
MSVRKLCALSLSKLRSQSNMQ